MGVGHELEAFELNNEKIQQEWGNLLKMYEFEYNETLKNKEKTEKMEKSVNDYFIYQISKVETSFDKIIQIINERRKTFCDNIKLSHNEHKKKYENDKIKILKKTEKLESINKEYYRILENLIENKKYEEFYRMKNYYLNEIKKVADIKIYQNEVSFAYFSNHFKIDDIGSLKFYKSFKEIELRNQEKKNKSESRKYSDDVNHIKSNDNQEIIDQDFNKMKNIFQDNLLNYNVTKSIEFSNKNKDLGSPIQKSTNFERIQTQGDTKYSGLINDTLVKPVKDFDLRYKFEKKDSSDVSVKSPTLRSENNFKSNETTVLHSENDDFNIARKKSSNQAFSHRDINTVINEANSKKNSHQVSQNTNGEKVLQFNSNKIQKKVDNNYFVNSNNYVFNTNGSTKAVPEVKSDSKYIGPSLINVNVPPFVLDKKELKDKDNCPNEKPNIQACPSKTKNKRNEEANKGNLLNEVSINLNNNSNSNKKEGVNTDKRSSSNKNTLIKKTNTNLNSKVIDSKLSVINRSTSNQNKLVSKENKQQLMISDQNSSNKPTKTNNQSF